MHVKAYLILFFCVFFTAFELSAKQNENESYVNALGSMTYYLGSCQEGEWVADALEESHCIIFSEENIQNLWDRICNSSPARCAAFSAYVNYTEAKRHFEQGEKEEALRALVQSYIQIEKLWGQSINDEMGIGIGSYHAERPLADYSPYPHLTSEMKHRFAHYLIGNDHPMKSQLDRLFSYRRVTANHHTFHQAGFSIISERPRSYVIVAKHKILPGYLVKCYLDTETRQKWHKPSWHWLEQRCIGARVIRKIIDYKKFKYFDVARKHLYILPQNLKVPVQCYTRHPVLLIAKDMRLVSKKDNQYAWRNIMDKKRLDELYYIITRAKGASYRADNIAFSYSKKFCFIDTEYPGKGPEYYRISRELSSDMAEYWNHLVTHGGKE